MKELTQEQYIECVGQNSGVVVLDFWAEWCGPCRLLKPQLEELSSEYAGKVNFYAVDVDSEGDLAMQFAIRSIPTVIIFVNGVVKDKIIGVNPKEMYKEKLDFYTNELLGSSKVNSNVSPNQSSDSAPQITNNSISDDKKANPGTTELA